VAGSKKTNTGGVRYSPRQTEQNGTYSNEGDQGQQTQSMKAGGKKVPTGITNKIGNAVGWSKINVKRHMERRHNGMVLEIPSRFWILGRDEISPQAHDG
jgi:hypothetical protein